MSRIVEYLQSLNDPGIFGRACRLFFIFVSVLSIHATSFLFVCSLGANESGTNRYNVLFIAVDDLRPELGCYGVNYIRSPQIDRLAQTGRRYTRHYVQVPTCGASRYALLTGRCPFESDATGNHAFFQGKTALTSERTVPGARTMPELFRRSGYRTVMIGKISHQPDGRVYNYDGSGDGRIEVPHAWDELATPYAPWKYAWSAFFAYSNGKSREDRSEYRPVFEMPEVADNELPDGLIAEAAMEKIDSLAGSESPFFLAVGFYKPHLPFVAPKRYWDLYEKAEIPEPDDKDPKTVFGHGSREFFTYQASFPKQVPLPKADAREVKRAYAACVSYVDAQIGKVLDRLRERGLDRNTIVVLWGDHGWHLGEHRIWGKHTLLEPSLRSPLIVRVPGMERPGEPTDAIVETVDLFPTLVDLCKPRFREYHFLQAGTSFRASLVDPTDQGKPGSFARFQGKTLRTRDYRIIAAQDSQGVFSKVELYDHRDDPGEMKEISRREPETTRRLLERLEAGRNGEGDRRIKTDSRTTQHRTKNQE